MPKKQKKGSARNAQSSNSRTFYELAVPYNHHGAVYDRAGIRYPGHIVPQLFWIPCTPVFTPRPPLKFFVGGRQGANLRGLLEGKVKLDDRGTVDFDLDAEPNNSYKMSFRINVSVSLLPHPTKNVR